MNKTTPRKRRRARTRQEILDAALELLHDKGPNELSLREIARRADYSPAGLYEYFENKEEIIIAVCAEGDRRLRAMLKAVPDTLPPDEYLIELGLAYIRYAKENEEHFMLNFSGFDVFRLDQPVPIKAILESDNTFNILIEAVTNAIDAGVIQARPDFGLLEIAYGLFGLAHGLAVLQLNNMKDIEFHYQEADRAVFKNFIEGLGK
jgi:AcrR family transcriptional regulator